MGYILKMGSSQSKDKKNFSKEVLSTSIDTSINKEKEIEDDKDAGSEILETSSGSPNSSNYDASLSSKSSAFSKPYPVQLQKIDFKTLENENPIQRRKRIMSGDRRNSYIMKLESIRQARREKEISDLKGTTSSLSSNSSDVIKKDFNENKKDLSRDSQDHLTTNESECRQQESNENLPDNKIKSERLIEQSSIISPDFITPVPYKPPEIKCKPIFDSKSESCEGNTSKMMKDWMKVVGNSNDNNPNRSPSLPNQLERFSTSYNPEDTFVKTLDNVTESSAPSQNDDKENVSKSNLKTNESKVMSDEPSSQFNPTFKFNAHETYGMNENKRQKNIFDLLASPVGFFSYCFNVGLYGNEDHKKMDEKDDTNKPCLNYKDIISFETDYSTDGFVSEEKLCDPQPEKASNTRTPSKTSDSENFVTSKKNYSKTLLSYKKVKNLFQRRIAEIENEESTRNLLNTSYYKELEELGRGHWRNGVWCPFDNSKLFKNIYE